MRTLLKTAIIRLVSKALLILAAALAIITSLAVIDDWPKVVWGETVILYGGSLALWFLAVNIGRPPDRPH
jgi:hypothetical protein